MEQATMADERILTKAETDAAIATLVDLGASAERTIRRAQADTGVNLLRTLNEVNGALAGAMNAIRLREIKE
jgi:hypothetical protein